MKKILLVIALIFGITTGANAQFKSEGFKLIGSVGVGISWVKAGMNILGLEGDGTTFGTVNPQLELTAGVNVMPELFIGVGLGYDARCGVTNLEGTQNELKVPAHVRFYTTPERNGGIIIDVKGGYSRLFINGGGMNGGNIFIGPGYMFSGKYAISLGYEGSFFRYKDDLAKLTCSYNGIAARFTYEF